MELSVLVVGAGQVGVAFGYHLVQGGARVGFLVKPAHEEAARRGFVLYRLDRRRARRYEPLALPASSFAVLCDPGQAAGQRWDYVLLALSSAGLRGEWFDRLVGACPGAHFVTFQLGLGDGEWIRARVPDERVIAGMLALISYPAPLAGEPIATPGTACWFAPGVRLPFRGSDRAAVERLVRALEGGGLPAAAAAGDTGGSRLPDFLLMALVAALELCGWSFAALAAHRDQVRLALAAAREAWAVEARREGIPPPRLLALITPGVLRGVLALARWLLPLPLEPYLRVHFTKLGAQVARDRALHLAEARRLGVPVPALAELCRALGPPAAGIAQAGPRGVGPPQGPG